LDRRLGGPQSRSGRGGEEKNSQLPPGIYLCNVLAIVVIPFFSPKPLAGSRKKGLLCGRFLR